MPFWILPAFGAALTDSFHNLFIKQQTREFDTLTVSWIRTLWIAVILLPLVFIFSSSTTPLFWTVMIVRTILDTAATVLYVASIKRSDLSSALPLIALTPLFIVVIEFVIFGILPSWVGFVGILLIVVGTYLLNFKAGESKWSPFKNLFGNAGNRMMLAVSLIWSVTSSLHTVAIRETNPYFYGGVSMLAIFLLLTLFILLWRGFETKRFSESNVFSKNAIPGVLGASSHIFQFVAQALVPASYVIAIKRTSILMSSIFAGIFLGESLKGRILGTVLSTLGVILVALSFVADL